MAGAQGVRDDYADDMDVDDHEAAGSNGLAVVVVWAAAATMDLTVMGYRLIKRLIV